MTHPAPNDIYQNDVDFTALALRYPDFAKRLKPNRQLDFSDPESVRQLTLSLLHRDFNLTLTLPPTRLCPPVPNRFTYILHLQRLLDSTSPTFRDVYEPHRQVIGIDIGCGASCIYPLLACRQREGWRMLATEIDETSRGVAQQNVDVNGLSDRVKIVETDPTSKKLIPGEVERFERIDFLMTNPPFYASHEQMLASAKAKSRPPNSSCTGAGVEMIYPYPEKSQSAYDRGDGLAREAGTATLGTGRSGVNVHPGGQSGGQPDAKFHPSNRPHPSFQTRPSKQSQAGSQHPVQPSRQAQPQPRAAGQETVTEAGEILFLTTLLSESLHPNLRYRIHWFTGMLGHLSSLSTMIERIRGKGCHNYVVWEFVHGQGRGSKDGNGKGGEEGRGKKGKTRRWGIGWSWMGFRSTVDVARGGGLGGGGGAAGVEKRLLPFPSEVEIEVGLSAGVEGAGGRGGKGLGGLEGLGKRVDEVLSELEDDDNDDDDDDDSGGARGGAKGGRGGGMQWHYKPQKLVGVGMSRQGDCWSRKARRKRQQQKEQHPLGRGRGRAGRVRREGVEGRDVEMKDADTNADARGDDQGENKENEDQEDENEEEKEPALVFKISIKRKHLNIETDTTHLDTKNLDTDSVNKPDANGEDQLNNAGMAIVHIRWLQGQDSVLFESFCGWLKRKISN